MLSAVPRPPARDVFCRCHPRQPASQANGSPATAGLARRRPRAQQDWSTAAAALLGEPCAVAMLAPSFAVRQGRWRREHEPGPTDPTGVLFVAGGALLICAGVHV